MWCSNIKSSPWRRRHITPAFVAIFRETQGSAEYVSGFVCRGIFDLMSQLVRERTGAGGRSVRRVTGCSVKNSAHSVAYAEGPTLVDTSL